MTPELGIHENVAALDFDSQFPNIIMRDGLSYEGEGYGPGERAFRLIPAVIAPFTNRRLRLKKLRKTLPMGSDLRRYCEQRIETLKMIAVTQYGIAGCCWNRLGNALTFEAINRGSRGAMVRAKQAAESGGFRVVYGDVDSLFVQKAGASREDYEALAARIAEESGLPMSLDRHFRFVGFLPLRGDGSSSALKRYFGVTFDGEVEARGVELRRSDTPELVREFQACLIGEVLGCADLAGVYSEGLERGREVTRRAIALVESGMVPGEALVVKRELRKPVGEYKAGVAHRSAAVQMLALGEEVEAGDSVGFVHANARHPNPLCRVALPGRSSRYDRRAYRRLIEEAARTVFSAAGAELFPRGDPLQTRIDWALDCTKGASRRGRNVGQPNRQGSLGLASSIMRQGLLQPITVRPKRDGFQLVSGNRRLTACRLLGWTSMPCLVMELDDRQAFEAALAENVARQTMNPLEEARAFHEYTLDHGWGSEVELARKIGKSPSYVSRRIKLLTLPPEKLQVVLQRRRNASLVSEIASIEDEELRSRLLSVAAKSKLSSKDVRRIHREVGKMATDSGLLFEVATSIAKVRYKRISQATDRIKAALRVALYRIDEVIENLSEEEWIVKDILMQQRLSLHNQIDLVINLEKKMKRIMGRTYLTH